MKNKVSIKISPSQGESRGSEYLASYECLLDGKSTRCSLVDEIAPELLSLAHDELARKGLRIIGRFESKKYPYSSDVVTPNLSTSRGTNLERIIPLGVPKRIDCYDSGERHADRYTVVFTGSNAELNDEYSRYPYLGMSSNPTHPLGVVTRGELDYPLDKFGKLREPIYSLGSRIRFNDLPYDCRKLVLGDYMEIWKL